MSKESDRGAISSLSDGVGHDDVAMLRHLATAGALDREVSTSAQELASELQQDISEERVSRQLVRLAEAGFLTRQVDNDEELIRVSSPGRRTLEREYHEYRQIFDNRHEVTLEGFVTSGMGEGAHYITLEGYARQFAERLGYTPFAGTLNVDLIEESVRQRTGIASLSPIPIDGWEGEDRTYGAATCYPVELVSAGESYDEAHALIPDRTHHDEDQLELIAPDRLRDVLHLADGDSITVRITGVAE
jgi:riboflavin kinase